GLVARWEASEGTGRAREWLDRAIGAGPDPCYVCAACGAAHGEWSSLCPQCGGFDTLAWRVPGQGIGGARTPLDPVMLPGSAPPLIPAAAPESPAPPSPPAPTPEI